MNTQLNDLINRKLATFYGIHCNSNDNWGYCNSKFVGSWLTSQDGKVLKYYGKIPNYCDDLNALHEIEHRLTPTQLKVYVENLCGNLFIQDGEYTGNNVRKAVIMDAQTKANILVNVISNFN